MARFWNGYQWRELADDRPREPELQPEPEPVKPLEGSRLSRSMKPTRLEPAHVCTFVNDACACGARDD